MNRRILIASSLKLGLVATGLLLVVKLIEYTTKPSVADVLNRPTYYESRGYTTNGTVIEEVPPLPEPIPEPETRTEEHTLPAVIDEFIDNLFTPSDTVIEDTYFTQKEGVEHRNEEEKTYSSQGGGMREVIK